eukprot:m.120885 g.120885  ORF g.120885 m.120885 type:complete len:350 (-) comp9592_c0_seq2:84-1133(-)
MSGSPTSQQDRICPRGKAKDPAQDRGSSILRGRCRRWLRPLAFERSPLRIRHIAAAPVALGRNLADTGCKEWCALPDYCRFPLDSLCRVCSIFLYPRHGCSRVTLAWPSSPDSPSHIRCHDAVFAQPTRLWTVALIGNPGVAVGAFCAGAAGRVGLQPCCAEFAAALICSWNAMLAALAKALCAVAVTVGAVLAWFTRRSVTRLETRLAVRADAHVALCNFALCTGRAGSVGRGGSLAGRTEHTGSVVLVWDRANVAKFALSLRPVCVVLVLCALLAVCCGHTHGGAERPFLARSRAGASDVLAKAICVVLCAGSSRSHVGKKARGAGLARVCCVGGWSCRDIKEVSVC